jgi:LysR family nitrogen assimilation transcriptional regulator
MQFRRTDGIARLPIIAATDGWTTMVFESGKEMRLNLRQLRYFLAIAETGTLSYAARQLNVAQSAVSHQLAELETRLGVALVERHPRGVTLTPAGRRLREHAHSILSAVIRAESELRSLSEKTSGPVSLGLAHTVARCIAVPLMRRIKVDHPDILMRFVEALSMPLVDHLLAGRLDFVLVYNPAEDARVEVRPVLEESLCLIGSRKFLDSEDDIAFEDIINFPLVMQYPSATARSVIANFHIRNRIPDSVMEFDSLFAMNQALIEGIGCTILPRSTATDALAHGAVVARRIVDPAITRVLYVARLSDRHSSKAEAELERLVIEAIVEEVKAGRWQGRLVDV